jgi:PUA domain protein
LTGCVTGSTDPNIMKKLQVDRGAIKFVLSGANIMCPGLTSPGGALDDEVDAETPVVWIELYCT